jgi:hypothetical protein
MTEIPCGFESGRKILDFENKKWDDNVSFFLKK